MEDTGKIQQMEQREKMLMASRDSFRDLYIETDKKLQEALGEIDALREGANQLQRIVDALMIQAVQAAGETGPEGDWLDLPRVSVAETLRDWEAEVIHRPAGLRIFIRRRGETDEEKCYTCGEEGGREHGTPEEIPEAGGPGGGLGGVQDVV